MGKVENSTQKGPADGSWGMSEVQVKENIYQGHHSTPCKLRQETSGASSGNMV